MAVTADFSVSSRVGDNFHSCVFTDASVGIITSRKWLFGDGEVSEGNDLQVTHFYREPGVYSVTLVVGNSSEQGSETKEDYIIVNDVKPVPYFIIMQSFNSLNGRYWKFYLDTSMYLYYENNNYLFVSKHPVLNIGKWSLLEFHPQTMKFFVGSYLNFREEIDAAQIVNSAPSDTPYTVTEILPKSTMKIDELKIVNREENLTEYYRAHRAKAALLDSLA